MINFKRLRKSEIDWLWSHRCRHGHRYITHQNCYLEENPKDSPIYEHIGHFDIEASNLKATFGICFSYAIKADGGKIYGRSITPQEIKKGIYDKKLLQEMVSDFKRFDVITTFYGARFDIPFCRSRAVKYRLEFPLYKEVIHRDVYDIVKRKLCLHSNRLQTVCDFLDIPSKGHPIKSDVWFGAFSGRKRYLDYIMEHNKEDVISLEAVYNRLVPYAKKGSTSI